MYDSRDSYTFPDTVDENGYLAGPGLYPTAQHEFQNVATVRQVVAGKLTGSFNSTANNQAVSVSNDGGSTWQTASNSDTVDVTFASGSAQIRGRVTLSRYGSRTNKAPTQNYLGQRLTDFQLFADLNDTPLLINQVLDGSVEDVLNRIARFSDSIWEYTYVDGTPTIQWTQPGQRTATAAESVTDFEITEDAGSIVKKAIIYGEGQPVRDEAVTATHDTAVRLAEDYLQPASEIVRSASDGTKYSRGSDYEMGWQAGTITALSSGSIADGESLEVDYTFRTRGVYESPDWSDGSETFSDTVAGVTTEQVAEQLALLLVKEGSTARTTATVDVESGSNSWSLTDALSFEDVPIDVGVEVYSVEDSPRGARLQLGSRDPVQERVREFQERLSAVSESI